MMQHFKLPIVLVLCMGMAACANLRFPGVYRIDIAQGNFVTEDMVEQLRPGMTREQVRFVMGAPLLTDPFTPDTWYYLLRYEPGEGETTEQQITIHFDEYDRLARFEGEVVDNLRARTTGKLDEESREALEEGLQQEDAPAEPMPQPGPEGDPGGMPPGGDPGGTPGGDPGGMPPM